MLGVRLSRGNELCQLNQSIRRTSSINLSGIPSHSASSSNISSRDDSDPPAAKMQTGRLEPDSRSCLKRHGPLQVLKHLEAEPSPDALSQPCCPCTTASQLTLHSTDQSLSHQRIYIGRNACMADRPACSPEMLRCCKRLPVPLAGPHLIQAR